MVKKYMIIKGRKQIIDDLPDGWMTHKLKKLCDLTAGGTPSTKKHNYWDNGTIRWMRSGEINKKIIYDVEERITNLGLNESSAKLIPSNSILIALAGQGKTRGKVAINKVELSSNQSIAAIIPKNKSLFYYYLYYNLDSRYDEIRRLSYGEGGRGGLNLHIISNIRVPIPPISEQHKIATILSTVDEATHTLQQLIVAKQSFKRGLMHRLFLQGIGHTEFKQTKLGKIPKNWKIAKIANLVSKTQYGLSMKMHSDGKYPIFRMNNIENGFMISKDLKYVNLSKEEFDNYRLEDRDILFNRTNSFDLVGKVGIFDLPEEYVFASYLIRLKVNVDICDAYYLNYYLNSYMGQMRIRRYATKGVSQVNINAENLKLVLVPLPNLIEQKKIAKILHLVDQENKILKKTIISYKNLKKGFMQQLLTGKIRVKVN